MKSSLRQRPIVKLRGQSNERLGKVALVALQHFLPSVPPLLERLLASGFEPRHTFILGKPYSAVPSATRELMALNCYVHPVGHERIPPGRYSAYFGKTVRDFWIRVERMIPPGIERLVVLDEGGWLSREIPEPLLERYPIVAIEHTTFGIINAPDGGSTFPTVMMASSAAKTVFESHVIADAIIRYMTPTINDFPRGIGILGLGNLGRAIALRLALGGHSGISGFDIASAAGLEKGIRLHPNLASLVEECEVILGCTGRDAMGTGDLLRRVFGRRVLASCSSGDVEFRGVSRALTHASRNVSIPRHSNRSEFADINGMLGRADVLLLNGGYPVNFDRTIEWENPDWIRLTRELTYLSVMQASMSVDPYTNALGVMLDPYAQQDVVEAWLATGSPRLLFPGWNPRNVDWWIGKSGGQYLEDAPVRPLVEIG